MNHQPLITSSMQLNPIAFSEVTSLFKSVLSQLRQIRLNVSSHFHIADAPASQPNNLHHIELMATI